ncbi:MAG: alpha/beta hydrolase [Spirochaetes bacterium]|nr:alpha/beta hydrolase [Spirochaetota bacterium]
MKKIKLAVFVIIVLMVILTAWYFLFPGGVIKAGQVMGRCSSGLSAEGVQVGDHHWAYLEGRPGEGKETILLLHGFAMEKDHWQPLSERLVGDYHLLIPDIPPFGESTAMAEGDYTIQAQVPRLRAFLEAVKAGPLHIMGVSMGGGIAGLFAARHPDMVKSLAMIGPYGVACPRESEFQRLYRNGSFVLVFGTPEEYDRTLSFSLQNPMELPGHIKAHIASKGMKDRPFLTRCFNDQIRISGWGLLERELGRITAPTLVIFGDKERIFDVSCAERYRKGIRGARVEVMKECGHLAYIDNPEEAARIYRSFLEGLRSAH